MFIWRFHSKENVVHSKNTFFVDVKNDYLVKALYFLTHLLNIYATVKLYTGGVCYICTIPFFDA